MNPIWYIRAAVLAALLGGVWWFSHARYAAGEAAGRAQVQKAWDAATLAQRTAYAEAAAAAAEKESADRKAAQEVENGLREQLAASDAAGRDTARRLRDYAASARRCAVPGAAAPSGQPQGPGGESGDPAGVGPALEDHLGACARDAERLDAWQAWCDRVHCWAP